MKISTIPFDSIPFFSKRDQAFQAENPALMSFVPYLPSIESLQKAIQKRKEYPINRQLFVSTIQEQYSQIDLSDIQRQNIDVLSSDESFTITTAHQPSLFTGPFYFILKICSTINLANQLNKVQSNTIVPIFIIGGEDHDFEEINHTYLFGNKLTWNRPSGGAVGRLELDNLNEAITQLNDLLGSSENAEHLKMIIEKAYQSVKTYGEFTFTIANQLFAKHGLLVLSLDQKDLKREFIPIIKKEVLESISKESVHATQDKIVAKGFKKQAHARDINFFYFTDKKRLRIERIDEDHFKIVDSSITFSTIEMDKEIDMHPERFSPNVIMRPIFQEQILPNIAYIGGGGELAYWMERHSQFDLLETFFPVLIRRNSAMYLTKKQWKLIENLDLNLHDLMKNEDVLIKEYVQENSNHSISLENNKKQISALYQDILEQTNQIDKSLEGKVKALEAQQIKELDKLEQRLIKKLKSNQEVDINKIRRLRNQLFPGNGLQERKTNFMEFYLKEGNTFIPKLIDHCDPLEKSFSIFIEE